MFWHHLALVLHCPVRELKVRTTKEEADDWKRFFMIFGPAGDQRLDEQFAHLRYAILASQGGNPQIKDLRLEYDYKRYFRQDAVSELEEMVNNIEKDIAQITALGARLQKHASAAQQ